MKYGTHFVAWVVFLIIDALQDGPADGALTSAGKDALRSNSSNHSGQALPSSSIGGVSVN